MVQLIDFDDDDVLNNVDCKIELRADVEAKYVSNRSRNGVFVAGADSSCLELQLDASDWSEARDVIQVRHGQVPGALQ